MTLPDFGSVSTWIDLGLGVLVAALFTFILYRITNRKFVLFYAILSSLAIILAWFFSLELLTTILTIVLMTSATVVMFVNISRIRPLIASELKGKTMFGFRPKTTEKIFDREAMYKKVNDAILALSKQKIGALLTFEKNILLTDVIKTGTLVNAPVTAELIMTIFYPGTRLHDGAVVVRGDTILAASVYFTPTTKPLTGKYGSRHRAAIGISEMSDAVTVVVSEETGRISLAYRGELQPVTVDTFLRVFREYMLEMPEEDEE
ncbi:MAG TPA: DNA integrity scanning protein DisA nucleotide-binding domain protein [Bacilli bacterium]|nr:DNA integrity scanning protein DisA nucleotide-binding domain protein [Bacilli bacterium]HPY38507.1 DNA integrity scanning protein DisA nucleotide-binding domain protein [Bacilli bacterium]